MSTTNTTKKAPAKAAAKKAPAKKVATPKAASTKAPVSTKEVTPFVTYFINGKRRATSDANPLRYSLGHLASETIGGKGCTAKLRELLATKKVTDPEHVEWDLTLDNGKVLSARHEGSSPPPVPDKAPTNPATKLASVDAMKEAAAKVKAVGRNTGDRKITVTKENTATILGMTEAKLRSWNPGTAPAKATRQARKAS